MDRFRLKQVIILILLFLNISLSISLLTQKVAERNAQKTASEQLVSLFAADGMQLDPEGISQNTPPVRRSISRDAELEQRIAKTLLGDDLTFEDQGGGITTYTGNAGTVQFRSGGVFEAVLTKPVADGPHVFSDFSKDFSYKTSSFSPDSSYSGTAVVLPEREHLIVYNAPTTFSFVNGRITSVSGTLIPLTALAAPEEGEMLSAAAALTAFQYSRQETGTVVSAILETSLCWEFQNLSGSMALIPTWQISTDTSSFYVNCLSGAVHRS